MWEIEYTDQFEHWWHTLTMKEQTDIDHRLDLLVAKGPALGRETVETITSSRHANMKELRAGSLRVLFAFDPVSNAILLVGGDKANRWKEFYTEMIPMADDLYDEHLETLKRERNDRNG